MILTDILSRRNYEENSSFHLIYEWEDQISSEMKINISETPSILTDRYFRHVPLLPQLFIPQGKHILFEMCPNLGKYQTTNLNRVISWIVDFFPTKHDVLKFSKAYKNQPLTLISSKEVFEFLKINNCNARICHLGLSLPDKYKLRDNILSEKRPYDAVFIGRQNKLLRSFAKQYSEENPSFIYIFREFTDGKFCYYTNKGLNLGNFPSRQDYLEILHKTKVAIYSTPNMDYSRKGSNGYNQVTPRFLEMVSAGCHIIARYNDNPDTIYYEMSKFSPVISTYSDFKSLMDKYLMDKIDYDFYEKYLNKHYTSKRINELKKIISEL